MNKKIAAVIGVILVILLGAFGFSQKENKKEANNESTTVTITDVNGENVELNKNPQKVIVFDYGIADILNNMDVEIVGLPKDGKLPELLSEYQDEKYKSVGSLKEPDFEAVQALNPDLIIISGRQAEMIEDFEEIAPTVNLGTEGSNYIASFKSNLENLGKLFDKEKLASELATKIDDKISELNKTITKNKISAITVLANEGNLSVFSNESRFGIIYNELGFINPDQKIEASTHGQQVSFEYFLEHESDYIFVVDRGAVTGTETSASVFENEIIKNTSAYKNNKIINLNAEVWYTIAGGVDSTMEMLSEIEAAISK